MKTLMLAFAIFITAGAVWGDNGGARQYSLSEIQYFDVQLYNSAVTRLQDNMRQNNAVVSKLTSEFRNNHELNRLATEFYSFCNLSYFKDQIFGLFVQINFYITVYNIMKEDDIDIRNAAPHSAAVCPQIE